MQQCFSPQDPLPSVYPRIAEANDTRPLWARVPGTVEAMSWYNVQERSFLESAWWVTPGVLHPDDYRHQLQIDTLTVPKVQKYREAYSEMLLKPLADEERFHVLDMQQITMNAPNMSAPDGMHYKDYVYDAAASVVLNLLASQPAASINRDCESRCELGTE